MSPPTTEAPNGGQASGDRVAQTGSGTSHHRDPAVEPEEIHLSH